jgi:LmbE family N-acetylglucosaminyl deacetylase
VNELRLLVIAPHPDDEVLGVGGTIARFAAEGAAVHVGIVTRGTEPLFTEEFNRQAKREVERAHERLGVSATHFLEFPAAELDKVQHRELNRAMGELIAEVRPQRIYVPFPGDIHKDHQLVFESALVACRPAHDHAPVAIYAYETLSETNWNAPYLTPGFAPNVFVDVSDHLEAKLEAMECYESQLKAFPNERSLESLRALAMLRGSTVGVPAAEAFVLVRQVM